MTFEEIAAIGAEFSLEGQLCHFEEIKRGNINSTYKAAYKKPDGAEDHYIIQKINTNVFHEPEGIMENIDLVTEHIRSRYPDETTLRFYHAKDGSNFSYDTDGSFWRVMNFVDSVSYDSSDDPDIIRSTGEAFGRFQNQLSDLDAKLLNETIPDFHNTVKRLDTLFKDISENPLGRNRDAESEINYIRSVQEEACRLSDMYNRGLMPVRATHNDTKSNNVLFDRLTGRPIVVIDLDTMMPGMSVYDFGDAVRSICSTAAEDEPELSKVSFDTGKFRPFCEGYLGAVKNNLTETEFQNLVAGAFSITIELASRFLDDYLTGDTYFKTDYPGHNLVRTRCQLTLARDIWAKKDELENIISSFAAPSINH